MPKVRTVVVGGFPGAGKTTALLRLADRLRAAGRTAGYVVHDLAPGSADALVAAAHGLTAAEAVGAGALPELAGDRPDVLLVESAGGLAAPSPMRRANLADGAAPYCVLLDPIRAERVLGLEPGRAFPEGAAEFTLRQTDAAEIVVVAKADLLDAARRDRLTAALASRHPSAKVVAVSARDGTGFDAWAELLESASAAEVAEAPGAAPLTWADANADVAGLAPFDANALISGLAVDLHRRLKEAGSEVAHLKLALRPSAGDGVSAVSLVAADREPEPSHGLAEPIESGSLAVNLRATGEPDALRALLEAALDDMEMAKGVTFEVGRLAAFRAG